MKIGFDNEKYLRIQSEHIRERIAQFDGKLYLELGGKLFDDHHASRVLPGFKPDSKLRMFAQLRDQLEIVIVVSAEDIEKNKVRADLGITYDEDVLRLREEFMSRDCGYHPLQRPTGCRPVPSPFGKTGHQVVRTLFN